MYKWLDKIEKENDIKKIPPEKYTALADEIRDFLIKNVSQTGGHLASNLGTVELTMALHLELNLPEDKIVWDVGHQAYTHKILTGRKELMPTLRQLGGMSGFPKRSESACDAFDTGHSSTSVSAALGMVKARDLRGSSENIFAVIGDGALSGGLAFEALNNAGRNKSKFVVVLNDNNMSISENVGAMANYLGGLRSNKAYRNFKTDIESFFAKVPGGKSVVGVLKRSKDSIKQLVVRGMLFENMGLTYIGPIDGHNIEQMRKAFQMAARMDHSTLVHVVTTKGKGYVPAEKNPCKFHGVSPFDMENGSTKNKAKTLTYTSVFGNEIVKLASENDKITAISAAMMTGTGLDKFAAVYPDRFFDVGIAEEHAVTFAAGMAAAGYRPVVAVYSTFLQRAYDGILHDVCIGSLPVTFAIDRAGIVGNDGETHQGIFDISYLSHIPNMVLLAPKNAAELRLMLRWAVNYNGPAAVRYPRGTAYEGLSEYETPIEYGRSEIIGLESKIALLAVGSMNKEAAEVREELKAAGRSVSHINVRFIAPFDKAMIDELVKTHDVIVTLEENVKRGGFGEQLEAYAKEKGYQNKIICIAAPDEFLKQGSVPELKKNCGMDADSIIKRIGDFCEGQT